MRKRLSALSFFVVGLFVTWVACWGGSHMEYRFPLKRLATASNGCSEIDMCSPPWWVIFLFVAYLFGPAVVWSIAGWKAAANNYSRTRYAAVVCVLSLMTGLFFLAGYALGPA